MRLEKMEIQDRKGKRGKKVYLVQKARRENPELKADQVSKDQRE